MRVISTLTLWDLQDTCAHHVVSWTANCLVLPYSFPKPRDGFTSYIKSKDIWLHFDHHSSDSAAIHSTAITSTIYTTTTTTQEFLYTQISQNPKLPIHLLGFELDKVYHGSQPILFLKIHKNTSVGTRATQNSYKPVGSRLWTIRHLLRVTSIFNQTILAQGRRSLIYWSSLQYQYTWSHQPLSQHIPRHHLNSKPPAIMCQWKTTQVWTKCGCQRVDYSPKPGSSCSCGSVTDQGTTTWEGYCNLPSCRNPPRAS